eukprot:1153886-Pelagomonas_calceolata.AAC.2
MRAHLGCALPPNACAPGMSFATLGMVRGWIRGGKRVTDRWREGGVTTDSDRGSVPDGMGLGSAMGEGVDGAGTYVNRGDDGRSSGTEGAGMGRGRLSWDFLIQLP